MINNYDRMKKMEQTMARMTEGAAVSARVAETRDKNAGHRQADRWLELLPGILKETEAAGEEETPSGQEMQQEESAVSSASATLQQNAGSDPSASPETRKDLVSDPPSTEDRQETAAVRQFWKQHSKNDSNEQSISGTRTTEHGPWSPVRFGRRPTRKP